MAKKVALVDLDGCLCRWDDAMIPALRSMESPGESYDYSDVWMVQRDRPYMKARVKSIMSKQGFWTGLKPYEAGLELYRYIAERFETYILTKALKECSLAWKEKVDWVHKYIGNDVGIMVVTEKKLVKGDLLFDDLPENCHNWLETNPNGRVIMPNRRYNTLRVTEEPRIHVWNDSITVNAFGEVVKADYDFTVPHKVISEVLAQ